jgi:hypothetical protein
MSYCPETDSMLRFSSEPCRLLHEYKVSNGEKLQPKAKEIEEKNPFIFIKNSDVYNLVYNSL